MRQADCDRIDEMLPLYLDGSLSPEESSEVNVHLAECRECARSLETYRSLESSLSSMSGIAADARSVADSVNLRLGLKSRRSLAPVFSRMSLAWSIAVATAAMILFVSRIDFVSPILTGQERFIETAGKNMEGWIASSSVLIAGFFTHVDAALAADPWLLTAGLVGFGMVIFAAGTAAAFRTLR